MSKNINNRKSFTSISKIGEFGLIEKISKQFKPSHENTIKGIGDDAAVIKVGESCLVISKDFLVEGIHFDLMYNPLKHLGYKSVVVNLSDIISMNVIPTQILISIAFSNRFSVEAIDDFYSGVKLACNRYNVDLIGGDTTSSNKGFTVSVTAIGISKESEIVYRSGAKENNLIVLSGDVGAAYLGLQILEREKAVFEVNSKMQPEFEGSEYLLERQLKPEARLDIINSLKKLDVKPTSMIDISDGLSSELNHLAKSSIIGFRIFEDKLPINSAVHEFSEKFNLNPSICALNGGEDYELLFTLEQKDYDKIKHRPDMTIIGYVENKKMGCNLVTRDSKVHSLLSKGWKSH